MSSESNSTGKRPTRSATIPKQRETLATLIEVARIATEDLELRPLLQRVTDTLALRFGWEFVAMIRVDQDEDRFTCEALTTDLKTSVYVGYGRNFGSGVVGEVAKTGEPVLIDDARKVQNFVSTFDGVLSEICVPVKHRGQVVAILNAESRRLAAFRRQVPLFEAIAEQISGAIANARLYEELRRRSSHLEVLVEASKVALGAGDLGDRIHRIADFLRTRFDFLTVAILVSTSEGNFWTHQTIVHSHGVEEEKQIAWPIDEGIVGRAISTGKSQLVLDVHSDPDYVAFRKEVNSELVVPMRFSERISGAVNYESDRPEVFDAESVSLLEAISVQVAGAIELAVLNDRLGESQAKLESANRELHRQTLIDEMTGVANRRHFDENLEREWRRATRLGLPLSLALFDVDCFKAFNDAYGHLRGDEALRRVAKALSDGLQRAGEQVARYGGEEFAAILPGIDAAAAQRRCEEMRRRIEDLAIQHDHSTAALVVTASAGIASLSSLQELSPQALLAAADEALYRAKNAGRNRVVSAV